MADREIKHNRPRGGKKKADAQRAARRAAREAVLSLLFETEFHEDDTPETVYLRALEARGMGEIAEDDTETPPIDPRREAYIRAAYMGIMEHLPLIDDLIGRHAKGWRTGRLSRVSRAILRLGAYELAFDHQMPAPIAINEAVELSKKYDEPKARAFINGVLNAIKDDIAANGRPVPVAESAADAPADAPDVLDAADAVETAPVAEGQDD